jgi:hypothetical protein
VILHIRDRFSRSHLLSSPSLITVSYFWSNLSQQFPSQSNLSDVRSDQSEGQQLISDLLPGGDVSSQIMFDDSQHAQSSLTLYLSLASASRSCNAAVRVVDLSCQLHPVSPLSTALSCHFLHSLLILFFLFLLLFLFLLDKRDQLVIGFDDTDTVFHSKRLGNKMKAFSLPLSLCSSIRSSTKVARREGRVVQAMHSRFSSLLISMRQRW